MPSNIINSVGPLFDMPAQAWTFTRCLGFPFNFGCSHMWWKLSLLWFSNRTEHLSVTIALSNCLFSQRHFSLNSNCLTLLGFRISWQYLVPVSTQLSFCRRCLAFSWENCNSKCRRILLVSSGETNLSFLSILVSTKFVSLMVTPWDGCLDLTAKNLMMLQSMANLDIVFCKNSDNFGHAFPGLPMVACTCNWCNPEKCQF